MRERGGCLWLIVGLFLALVAGGLAFTAMLKATSAQPAEQIEMRAPVVVVARDVPPRTEIKPEDLITKDIPLSAIPDNAVQDQATAVGKVSTSQLIPGEILLEPRIADPGEPGRQVHFKTEPGKVVMAFPADDLMSQGAILEPGDVVDILYSIEVEVNADTEEEAGEKTTITFWTLQQVPIAAVVLPPEARSAEGTNQAGIAPQSILLALDPQDALVLKHLKDTNGIVDIVLRAREDDTEFETEPVDLPYIDSQYNLIPDVLP